MQRYNIEPVTSAKRNSAGTRIYHGGSAQSESKPNSSFQDVSPDRQRLTMLKQEKIAAEQSAFLKMQEIEQLKRQLNTEALDSQY